MTTLTWQGRLNTASTETEVVAIAREYLATFTPTEIARLPEMCRPRKMVGGSDISAYALVLVRHDCADDSGTERLVFKLASFFSNASIRLSALMTESNASEHGD